jgi:hypothetical protein
MTDVFSHLGMMPSICRFYFGLLDKWKVVDWLVEVITVSVYLF